MLQLVYMAVGCLLMLLRFKGAFGTVLLERVSSLSSSVSMVILMS